jgi:2,4-dienoyl-CoA reductase-like NADH-dependent reductase (Old Yellow Enzyme family)
MEPINVLDKIEISIDHQMVVTVRMLEDSIIDAGTAEEAVKVASEISDKQIHCNLVDVRGMSYISSAARKVFGSQNKPYVKAIALVINSNLHRSLVNLYFKFSPPIIETRVFEEEDEARNWLINKLRAD